VCMECVWVVSAAGLSRRSSAFHRGRVTHVTLPRVRCGSDCTWECDSIEMPRFLIPQALGNGFRMPSRDLPWLQDEVEVVAARVEQILGQGVDK
jgi:hypothetical protein